MKTKKKQRRVVGDVVRVDLEDGTHTYARVLPDATFAFYDKRDETELAISEILGLPVLFEVAVMDHAVKEGRWTVVGHAPLDGHFSKVRPRFIQDRVKPDSFSIYESGAIRPALRHECVGLEAAAVWEPAHVEDRLRDHYAGRTNKWVESLRIK
jgi:hypothetical protein